MNLFELSKAVVLMSDALACVRPCEQDEEISTARETDIPALLEIGHAVHARAVRTEEVFKARFNNGRKAYLLRKAGTPTSYLWTAETSYNIHPLRLRLELPKRVHYFFDETTAPAYRRRGMLGKLMEFAWRDNSLHAAAICVRADNRVSLSANSRLGFCPVSTISMFQLIVFRMHRVQGHQRPGTQTFFSRPTLGPRQSILTLHLESNGKFEVGRGPASRPATPSRPLTECDLA